MKNTYILASILFAITILQLNAQIDVKQKAKDKTIDRADQRTDEGIDKGLDAVEDGVKSLFKKKSKTTEAKSEETTTDSDSNQDGTEENEGEKLKSSNKPAQPSQTLTSSTKYDFVPGDKILLYDDFSQDAIGDFPALWTTTGSGEVRTLNLYPGNWFYMNASEKFYNLAKDLSLPENYILEFDVVPTVPDNNGLGGFYLTLYRGEGEFLNDELVPGTSGFHITINTDGWEVSPYIDGSYLTNGSSELAPVELNKLNHIIVWVQKSRLRIYHKGLKALDLPTSVPVKEKFNRFRFSLWGNDGLPYISNVRFTTAAPDTRSKLLTEGKLISYGIYFDVNSDKVKPESNGALNDIAKVLKENPAVRVKIVGHTDSNGDDVKNLDLSKRRAASVKNELQKTFGIDGARIETDGKGESQPISPNNTPADKAQNRRVEFLKL